MKPITLYLDKDGDKTWTDPKTGQVYQMCKAPAFDINSKAFQDAKAEDLGAFAHSFEWALVQKGVVRR